MAKYKLLLPKMGESVAEATVIRWTKSPGDYIEADETVMEIATDKVDSDVPSPVAGRLLERFYKDNDVVQVGAVIAIIETNEPEAETTPPAPIDEPLPAAPFAEPIVETPPPVPSVVEEKAPAPPPAPEPAQPVFAEQRAESVPPVPYTEQLRSQPVAEDSAKGGGRFYSPLVKNIAAQENISNAELDQI